MLARQDGADTKGRRGDSALWAGLPSKADPWSVIRYEGSPAPIRSASMRTGSLEGVCCVIDQVDQRMLDVLVESGRQCSEFGVAVMRTTPRAAVPATVSIIW